MFTEQVSDPVHARGLESAMPGLVASLRSWGMRAGHWLPDRNGESAFWQATQTEAQRIGPEAVPWLEGRWRSC